MRTGGGVDLWCVVVPFADKLEVELCNTQRGR